MAHSITWLVVRRSDEKAIGSFLVNLVLSDLRFDWSKPSFTRRGINHCAPAYVEIILEDSSERGGFKSMFTSTRRETESKAKEMKLLSKILYSVDPDVWINIFARLPSVSYGVTSRWNDRFERLFSRFTVQAIAWRAMRTVDDDQLFLNRWCSFSQLSIIEKDVFFASSQLINPHVWPKNQTKQTSV